MTPKETKKEIMDEFYDMCKKLNLREETVSGTDEQATVLNWFNKSLDRMMEVTVKNEHKRIKDAMEELRVDGVFCDREEVERILEEQTKRDQLLNK